MIQSALPLLLEDRRMNARELAEAVGISRNTLSTFINGTASGIRYDTINKLCDFFNITPSDLLLYSPYNYKIVIDPYYLDSQEVETRGTIRIDMVDHKNPYIVHLRFILKRDPDSYSTLDTKIALNERDIENTFFFLQMCLSFSDKELVLFERSLRRSLEKNLLTSHNLLDNEHPYNMECRVDVLSFVEEVKREFYPHEIEHEKELLLDVIEINGKAILEAIYKLKEIEEYEQNQKFTLPWQ